MIKLPLSFIKMNSTNHLSFGQGTTTSQSRQQRYLQLVRVVMAESVGTFILVLVACAMTAQEGGSRLGDYAAAATSAVMLAVFTVANISGAHLNPAITVALAADGHFPWFLVPAYMGGQLGGSTAAAGIAKYVYQGRVTTHPADGHTGRALAAETVSSFIVGFCVSSVVAEQPRIPALPVGAAIWVGVTLSAALSGASMNSVRSVGAALVSSSYSELWVYLIGPTVGTLAGYFLHSLLHGRCNRRPLSPNSTYAVPQALVQNNGPSSTC